VRPSTAVPPDYRSLPREDLLALVRRLFEQTRIMRAQIRSLRRALEEARAKKGHAPFSKGKRKDKHGRPGRTKGKGPFRHRQGPAPSKVTNWLRIDDPKVCPHCGSPDIEIDQREYFSTTDIPEEPAVKVTAGYRPKGHCSKCHRTWSATHPDVPDDQTGATAHRLGPRVRTEAHRLHYSVGVPTRRVPSILEIHGIKVTQGALTQDALKAAEKGPVVEKVKKIRQTIPAAPNVHNDATGWRINGASAALMVAATPDTDERPGVTVYDIKPHHGAAEVIGLVGPNFKGTLNVDRGVEYQAKVFEATSFQRCMGHLTKNVKEVLETKAGAARDFGERLLTIKNEALALHADWHAGRRDNYEQRVARTEARLTDHLRDRRFTGADNQRLLDGFGTEHDKGNLLRFLHDPQISPFNYLAERELRPPIVARKISHCSKNERGANAHAKLSTLFRTEERLQRFEDRKAKKTEEPSAPSGAPSAPTVGTRILNRLAPLFRRGKAPPPQPPSAPATDPPK
jgi:hypothetical protein